MASRIEGPDPPSISCADVRTWLTHVFLSMPGTAVYSARSRSALEPFSADMAPGPLKVLDICAEVLAGRERDHLWLLTWARGNAIIEASQPRKRGRIVAPAGCSVATFCDQKNIRRSTFDRAVERACRDVAAEWSARIKNST